MPWKCPACGTSIRQQLTANGHETPQPGWVYRCVVCRLELALGADTLRLEPAPVTPDAKRENTTRVRAQLAAETAEQLRDWAQQLVDDALQHRNDSLEAIKKAERYVKDRRLPDRDRDRRNVDS